MKHPENKKPLGYIELSTGLFPIYHTNDIFLGYCFENPEHWEILRLLVNLPVSAYRKIKPDTSAKLIEGKIKVRTQFKHLLKNDGKTTRNQDIRITEDDEIIFYIEFQNRANTNPPIEIRSVEYFGLGISRGKGKIAHQIWLLAEDVESVLHGETFAHYILKDENTGNLHPSASSIMYVSLTKLSQEKNAAGELASFLLGKNENPEDETVKKVAATFNSSFQEFKEDKDVVEVLSLAERYIDEGIARGEARGEAKGKVKGVAIGANKLAEFIRSGLSLEDALQKIDKEQYSLAEAGN